LLSSKEKGMKGLFIFICALCLSVIAVAQAPQAISYQAVLRDASGNVLASQPAALRFSILQGSITGAAVYVETQNITTSSHGAFSLGIGNGTAVSGSFAGINWAGGPYFLQTELDTGSGYVVLSTSQFLSVPYALYAGSVANQWGANHSGCIDSLTSAEVTFISETHTDSDNNNIPDEYNATFQMDSIYFNGITGFRINYKFSINDTVVLSGDNPWGYINSGSGNGRTFAVTLGGYTALPGDRVKAEFFFQHLGCTAYFAYIKQL
jgi:hypothetical protein